MLKISQEAIMKNWGVDNTDTPLVSVRCITYNHEQYISQALDGFLMQKTNFPYEVIVHDDASTDNTANIIREYETKFPKIIKPIYETENQWSKPDNALGKIVNAALKGKYVAFCEGDDYWIDENKLQTQVDFLESNIEYGLCYTTCLYYYQEKARFSKKVIGGTNESFSDIFLNYTVPFASVLLRRNLFSEFNNFRNLNGKSWRVGDLPLLLWVSLKSKIKAFEKPATVYRVLKNSASHFDSFEREKSFKENVFHIYEFFYYFSKINDTILLEKIKNNDNKLLCVFAIKHHDYDNANKYSKLFMISSIKDRIIKIICSNIVIFKLFCLFYKLR